MYKSVVDINYTFYIMKKISIAIVLTVPHLARELQQECGSGTSCTH